MGALLATAALAQPVQPPPATSAPVSDLLASAPAITISNGQITAKIARIDAAQGFYNGTRFDQAGVVTSLTLNGKEFYGPWFEKTASGVLDYTYVGDDIVAGPDSAISGPVEEFAPLDFEAKPGLFIKPGVGILYQPDNQPYDHGNMYYRFLKPDQSPRTRRTQITSCLDSKPLLSSLVPDDPRLRHRMRLDALMVKELLVRRNRLGRKHRRLRLGSGGLGSRLLCRRCSLGGFRRFCRD